jgi:hypothetical protein
MKYYYLKIDTGNAMAYKCLESSSPTAVVFFDNLTETDYSNGGGKSQPRNFWSAGKSENRSQTIMVVLHDAKVWFLQPAGVVEFQQTIQKGKWSLTPKVMPVKILRCAESKDVAPVLAGMSANQFYTRGTFREITGWGNLKAIDRALNFPCEDAHWILDHQGPAQLLECLSSVELETLVAKLLEAHGCFVPAYLGGVTKDVDIFAHNDSDEEIRVGQLVIAPMQRASIQIKLWSGSMVKPANVDYLVGLDVKGPSAFDAEWLLGQVKACPAVCAWLARSLNWLPGEFLEKFGLSSSAGHA